MEIVKEVQRGNTLYIKATFKDDTKTLTDPANVTATVYRAADLTMVTEGEATKLSTGVYQYPYIPTEDGSYLVEMCGILAGLPSLRRKQIRVQFV